MSRFKDSLIDGPGCAPPTGAPWPNAGRADLADIAASLGLRQAGREWVGACPACGDGVDRFRLTGDGKAFCRVCCPDGRDGDAVRRLRQAAGLDDGRKGATSARGRAGGGQGARKAANGRPGPDTGDSRAPRGQPSGQSDASAARIAVARAIWAAAAPADGTLARRYLSERLAWPPDGCGPDLPPSVRWLPRERAPAAAPAGNWFGLTGSAASAAGAILYAFAIGTGKSATEADLVAVSADALDADGRRVSPRWRRTFGTREGALFDASGDGPAIVIAEGEVSALACRWLHPVARCLGAGGKDGLASIEPAMLPAERRPVRIEADGDRAGRDAARSARKALPGAAVTWRRNGTGDPADGIAEAIAERVAIVIEGGAAEAEALATAWRDMLATHGGDPNSPPELPGAGAISADRPPDPANSHAPDAGQDRMTRPGGMAPATGLLSSHRTRSMSPCQTITRS